MDPHLANELNKAGATILCLDVPEGTEFGVDCRSWNTGAKFCGLKMVPSGFHFFYYNATSKTGNISPRNGFFMWLQRSEIVIMRWDSEIEVLRRVTDEDEVERYQHGVRRFDFDAGLGPYPLDAFCEWKELSALITPNLTDRALPRSGVVDLLDETPETASSSSSQPPPAAQSESDWSPERVRYTHVPRRVVPKDGTAADVTAANLDKTQLLLDIVKDSYEEDEIQLLGEIQLAFICFMLGHSMAGLYQWKNLVHLLCESHRAVVDRPRLYSSFLRALYQQLTYAPDDFFAADLSSDNFLRADLKSLREDVDQPQTHEGVKEQWARFRELVEKRFKWSLGGISSTVPGVATLDDDDEDEEYKPVVVEDV